jgi:hypothetical protein
MGAVDTVKFKYKFKVHLNNNNNSLIASRRSTGSAQPLLRPFIMGAPSGGLLLNRNCGFVFERLSLKNFCSSTRYLSTSPKDPNIPAEF